jgi:hypothetical protein
VSAAAEESEPPATELTSAVVRDEIKALLGDEARRKESIERRGVGVITVSAALVTLILTVGQLAYTSVATGGTNRASWWRFVSLRLKSRF